MKPKEVKQIIKGSIFNADLQKQAIDFVDAQVTEIENLKNVIRKYKEVTAVLGKGIGHIAPPDNFFALWNETEVAGSKAVRS